MSGARKKAIIRFVVVAFWLAFVPQGSRAHAVLSDGEETRSSASLSYRSDSVSTSEISLQADWGFESGTRLSAGLETTRSPASLLFPDGLDLQEFRVGIGSEPREKFSYSFQFTHWHQAGLISVNALAFQPAWVIAEGWILVFKPQLRFVSLTLGAAAPYRIETGSETILFTNSIFGLSLAYRGWAPWFFTLNGNYQTYTADLDKLQSSQSVRFFSFSALTYQNSFLKYDYGIEAGWDSETLRFSAEFFDVRTPVGDLGHKTAAVHAAYRSPEQWDLDLTLGYTTRGQEILPENRFMGLTGTFHW
jgi:hypothetical protein